MFFLISHNIHSLCGFIVYGVFFDLAKQTLSISPDLILFLEL